MKKTFTKNEIPDVAKDILGMLLTARGEKGESAARETATVIALSGELGAGKTTLTQALARELGIRENVISPTFVIMKSYALTEAEGHGFSRLIHIDAYRLDSASELEKLGWAELLGNPRNLILIEWPEKVPEAIPEHTRRITLWHKNEEEREIEF